MKCQFIPFGLTPSGTNEFAIHFHYGYNYDSISGLEQQPFVNVQDSEQLRQNSTFPYESSISFNRTIGCEYMFRIYVPDSLIGLKFFSQSLSYWEGGNYTEDFKDSEIGLRKFTSSHDTYPLY